MIWPFTRKSPATPTQSARELAQRGAAIRKSREIAKRNETTAKLCAEMGKPMPKVFAEGRA